MTGDCFSVLRHFHDELTLKILTIGRMSDLIRGAEVGMILEIPFCGHEKGHYTKLLPDYHWLEGGSTLVRKPAS